MTRVQRFLRAVLPARLADQMEAESRAWVMRCALCGHEQSFWELGGVRWKAAGNPRYFRRCASCGRRSWHKAIKRA